MLKAIAASKKKTDQVDARTIADILRCDLEECYMAPPVPRDLRYPQPAGVAMRAEQEPYRRPTDGNGGGVRCWASARAQVLSRTVGAIAAAHAAPAEVECDSAGGLSGTRSIEMLVRTPSWERRKPFP
jgi:hypothetical protein